ncbi:MAG TPA: 5-oxoprolinase subunit PxpA [Terriglobales bacterium]
MPLRTIDLNADLGEFPERLADGSDAELMHWVTSANIACGGHAGDESTIEQTLELAREHGVAAGAHPSYPDPPGFGRTVLQMEIRELEESVTGQMHRLLTIARRMQVAICHVKPHGALYHACNCESDVTRAIGRAVLATDHRLIVVGQAGSPCLAIYRHMGLRAAAEAFADRAYEPDGSLRNRSLAGALLDSPDVAAAQAVALATRKVVATTSGSEISISAETLCLHSDTPGSAVIAQTVRASLQAAGVAIRPLRRDASHIQH